MLTYCIKRIIAVIPVMVGVVVAVSLMTHWVPGDPVDAILGDYASLEDKERLRQALGLDLAFWEQLQRYFGGLLQGQLGDSLIYNKPVALMIGERLTPTVELAVAAMVVSFCLSLPLGIMAAVRQNTWVDYSAMGFAVIGVAIPHFWLGPLLVLLFSLELDWLPVSERSGISSYILPALTMGIALAAALSRMTRNTMLDVLKEDFIRTARAKGCPDVMVIGVHALRNAALPLVTVIGLQFGAILTGAVITEKVFDWPGVGSLLLEGIHTRDYPVVQGCVLLFSCTYLIVNLLTDLLYAVVDPRIRIDGAK